MVPAEKDDYILGKLGADIAIQQQNSSSLAI